MENRRRSRDEIVERILAGRRCSRCCGDYFDFGGNINPLLWGGYKVYRVKICG